MKKFEIMTKYIPLISGDNFGECIIDRENDALPEHPMHMPFVNYSEMVHGYKMSRTNGSSSFLI